jgi:hypothetical protein
MATPKQNKIEINNPLTTEESDLLINTLIESLSISGTPSEVLLSAGLLPSDESKRKTNATKELVVKDSHFANFEFPLGKTIVFSYTDQTGVKVNLNAIQLVYLLKNNQASYKDTLQNEYLIKGGIDFGYEPIGATLPMNNGDNSALKLEFKAIIETFSTDKFAADVCKNGRKPDQFRLSVNHDVLTSLYPEKLRYNVMQSLFSNGLEFLEFIRDDDDKIITVIFKKFKD